MADSSRRLVILRHAKSDWPEGVPDAERPLADRGRRDAPAAGQWLAQHIGRFDVALCSTAVRARQTWDLVAPELGAVPQVRYDERIYAASVDGLLTVLRELPETAQTALIIGHNPGLEEVATALTGMVADLKTAGIVVITLPDTWVEIAQTEAALEVWVTPRPG